MQRKWRWALAMACGATIAAHAGAVEQAEDLTVAKVPPYNPHQIDVLDVNFPSMTDGRIHVLSGDDGKYLGQIDAGFAAGFAISPDHKTTYVATTYFSRGSHGTRTDVVESTDNATLDIAGEVVIPAKHAQTVPSPYNTSLSADGKWLYVSNITPATSVTVVDTATHKVAGEIDTDGCVLAYPTGNDRFTSLCESGKALTVVLDGNGKEKSRKLSDVFIDVDNDPAFVNAVHSGGDYWFTTFNGNVRRANFAGSAPVFGASWPLVSAPERKAGWRPGGLQQTALNGATQRLYVAMHQGTEGSHKDPASEIWVFDMKTHKRVARWKLADQKIDPLLSIQVSQDAHPLFYGITIASDVVIADALTGKVEHVVKQVGHTASLLLNP
ncbi:amine dehydrogenase large subunit [Trinickia dinghuensis]|uniref:Amine dehydrogenase n=1 Tax=Trinickia dinghuensis TaxID=2291023 RepID=A0A3D8JVF2_9BURK|nr:amine dehydrogenase large subunit [Trinickia dinghuensis]RDU96371.1 amine dehydrogenase [Trinickia dinghuensis]